MKRFMAVLVAVVMLGAAVGGCFLRRGEEAGGGTDIPETAVDQETVKLYGDYLRLFRDGISMAPHASEVSRFEAKILRPLEANRAQAEAQFGKDSEQWRQADRAVNKVNADYTKVVFEELDSRQQREYQKTCPGLREADYYILRELPVAEREELDALIRENGGLYAMEDLYLDEQESRYMPPDYASLRVSFIDGEDGGVQKSIFETDAVTDAQMQMKQAADGGASYPVLVLELNQLGTEALAEATTKLAAGQGSCSIMMGSLLVAEPDVTMPVTDGKMMIESERLTEEHIEVWVKAWRQGLTVRQQVW